MTHYSIDSVDQLLAWADEQGSGGDRFAFRGQGNCQWPLVTSLARYFKRHKVKQAEWRDRELKMYTMFRNRLIKTCPNLYDKYDPIDILSIMQHHGVATRLIDFTFDPLVAVYFALQEAAACCAVWVLDKEQLTANRFESSIPEYCGPSHDAGYRPAVKHHNAGSIMVPERQHPRSAAQRACFFVPGMISPSIPDYLVSSMATIDERIVLEGLTALKGRGYDRDSLFPDIDAIARDTNRFAVTGYARL